MGTANEQAKRDFLQCLLRLHTRAGEPAPESLAARSQQLPERISAQDRHLLSFADGPTAGCVSLANLLDARTELGLPVREIHERYVELGAAVPDQESVREALARVPRRPAAG